MPPDATTRAPSGVSMLRMLWFSCGLAFAAYAWTHWGIWWALVMFFGWPVWLAYTQVVLRVLP